MALNKIPDDFIWGAATAAYQIEGAWNADGKGPSIWDTFTSVPENINNGDNGRIACDHYSRYEEDVKLMADIGLKAYRFSVSWPRIIPEGKGKINPEGIKFYNKLIDKLLENNIDPWITLYHWDLPQKLQDEGGWENRVTSEAFREYAKICYDHFGDRVKNWITLNEPMVVSFVGYWWGAHAPGVKDSGALPKVIHHLNLAHGYAVNEFRKSETNGKIGITLNAEINRPATLTRENIDANEGRIDLTTGVFMGPIFKGRYPENLTRNYPDYKLTVQEGDLENISAETDFLGINYYYQKPVSFDPSSPERIRYKHTPYPKTDMNWDIYPSGLLYTFRWIQKNYPEVKELYITENGAACPDKCDENGYVNDYDRIAYLKKHFAVCEKALTEGVLLKGYFLWSLLDNFEWAHGFSKRFGIIRVDYKTLKRTPKASYYYYRDVITGNILFD